MSPHKTNKNMETSFKQTTSNKVERYRLFLPQFELLISDEKEEIRKKYQFSHFCS